MNLRQGQATTDQHKQITWSAYLLDTLMYPLIAFSIGHSAALFSTGIINFNFTSVKKGNAWNSATDTFVVPRNGAYVFWLRGGATSGKQYDIYVYINEVKSYAIYFDSDNRNGVDTSSRTFAVLLNVSDKVYLKLGSSFLFSDNGHQISFVGFLY